MDKYRTAMATVVVALVGLAAACGRSDMNGTGATASATPSATSAPRVESTEPAADETRTTSTVVDDAWIADVEAACARVAPMAVAITPNDGTANSMSAEIEATRAVFELEAFASLEVPHAIEPTLDKVRILGDEALVSLDRATESVADDDLVTAQRQLDEGFDRLVRIQTAWAIAGAGCAFADPQRAASADLTVPLEMAPWQINVGFGSLWVSELLSDQIVRLDPDTGDVIARIDVGEGPAKAQPADGHLWVRTDSSYDAIDPATNMVSASIPTQEVGQHANRSWAVDGAMWICDGKQIARYDPTTATPVARIDVGLDCNAVFATTDLVVAWNYNEDPGESGTSAAAFIDPSNNSVVARVDLPADVGGPAVLDDAVYFPGHYGRRAAVVDRANWEVTETPDMGGTGGGSGQAATDGTAIYVVNDAEDAVLVIDASTFAPVDRIEPLGVNAVALNDGALWTTIGHPYDAVQRFDIH